MFRTVPTFALAALLALLAAPVSAAELPHYASDRHEGVATCAGPLCHGAARPGKHAVLQTEYYTWAEEGGDFRHSKAYDALLEPLSKRIARNLGLAKPAHETTLCLDCHADNVSKKLRGAKFQIESGVGCEACHGGSERWLEPHDTGQPHARNVALGLFPTDDPVARAELCLSCHFGDEKKFVDHRLMGAGHPRQSFELFLFTMIQPAHHEIDADYTKRGKQAAWSMKEWALGQAVAVREILGAMLDPKRARHGIWPEFVLFDCHACHHEMSDTRWRPRSSANLGPGLARLNDASFLMLRQALLVVDAPAAQKLSADLRGLHAATSRSGGDQQAVARRLKGRTEAAIGTLQQWSVTDADVAAIAKSLLAEGAGGEYGDYAGAEQATIALQILLDARYDAISKQQLAKVEGLVDAMVDNIESPKTFDPKFIADSFEKLQPIF